MGDFNISKALELNKAQTIGKTIIYKKSTGTTMDDAKECGFNGSPHGTAVIAELQTKARGAKNNKWSALHTDNIYVSFVLHNVKLEQGWVMRFKCEVAASLAVLRAVNDLGIKDVNTKWPNDLWIKGHKLAGFLMEEVDFDIPDAYPIKHLAILGIGVNVNSDVRRNPELYSLATSIKCELGGYEVCREELFANMCLYLEENLAKSRRQLHKEFIQHQLFKPGTDVVVLSLADNESYPAQILKIKDNWNLVFQTKDGIKEVDSSKHSVRPRISKIVYIVTSCNLDVDSSQELYRILLTLVDTSKYNIKYLKLEDLEKGNWRENAHLVVIGAIVTTAQYDWCKCEDVIRDYVSNGGSLFCIGHILRNLNMTNFFIDKVGNEEAENSLVGIRLQSEVDDVNVSLCCRGNPVLLKMTDSTDTVLAWYQGTDNAIAIVTKNFGKGKICGCGFNLEITCMYEDLENLTKSKLLPQELEQNVFHQDKLFQNILKSLSIE
ncbi:uncharacterized protein LOC126824660 [Patella vulgata]|uniref:uncharacterized protein LOC126824660 n=1 Tax=Patella vulgata TaxID=6465 RepID=UPI00217F2A5F|nr:uncharacterized protein LOC126824660 [Patella vulgata]